MVSAPSEICRLVAALQSCPLIGRQGHDPVKYCWGERKLCLSFACLVSKRCWQQGWLKAAPTGSAGNCHRQLIGMGPVPSRPHDTHVQRLHRSFSEVGGDSVRGDKMRLTADTLMKLKNVEALSESSLVHIMECVRASRSKATKPLLLR